MTKLQKQIAASTDEIMWLTEDICKLTLEYGNIPTYACELKQNVLLEQCRRLSTKLKKFQKQIEDIPEPDYDTALSEHILSQNQLLLEQNIQTLKSFDEHAGSIKAKLKLNHELENQIFIQNIQRELQQMLHS